MALLSLAEAFLRVPDPETADQLISYKIGEGDWRAHSGKSNSLLVNSATWGLLIGRAMVEDEQGSTVLRQIGRAHVGTQVTNAQLVCRLLIEKKKHTKQH